jgi:hypothetical protein
MRSARCRYLARITGVAIVTDSTSYLPAALVRQPGIRVVPLQIVIGGMAHDESAPRPRRTPSPRRTVQSSAASWRATTAESSTPRGTGFLPYSMDLPER